ncbi:MAG: Fe-S oxidoreductase [Acidobacteria bacterium]|nr:MAG: Fe-S oxidoreductase [Acidobacteriota bacterium]
MELSKPRVSLFVTCLGDQFFPEVGECAVRVLRHAGCEVAFDPAQTCCGQPAFNTGFRQEAREVATRVLDIFRDAQYVVAPSGSCTTMVRVFYRELFADDPERLQQAESLGRRIFEFSEFLVRVLKVEDVGASFRARVAYHDSCHLLRELGIEGEPRKLIRAVRGVELVKLEDYQLCCGFGGTFSVKFPEVSVAMGEDKIRAAREAGAEVLVANDSGCLMHLAGVIHRQGLPLKTMHLAELLAKHE